MLRGATGQQWIRQTVDETIGGRNIFCRRSPMKKWMPKIFAFAVLFGNALFAQDLTGTWQGALKADRELRIVVKISKGDDGGLKAVMYSIDQAGGQEIPGVVTHQGSVVKLSVPGIGGSYEAKLNSDGASMTGTWSQGGPPMTLNLKHVNSETAWPIPEPPAPAKSMAADAPLAFEVATIKPSKPGTPGKSLLMKGPRQFVTTNTSLADLITFAYGMHVRQITGGPSWLESDLFDIIGQPEAEGTPNRKQLEGMLQRLLADRFKLAFHREKKELSVYAIIVGKNGPKLLKSTSDPNGLPGLFFRGLGVLPARNSNISDLAGVLQSVVLERPVVDQTGLSGRYDFELKWTPDESQFSGQGAKVRRDDPDAPPDLFTAIQEQLGLQLKSTKASVDVLVIDRVEKPSEN
jgi:uncharacterized protein (TIGR03435 family)